ncbi:hypothetical protein Tco_0569287 [Tanacetum coccineum]
MSVEDPLVIVCPGYLSPKIHAPCAIFVDINKSKEEIMSVLFPRKNTRSVDTSSHSVNVGTTLEPPSQVNSNLNANPVNICKAEGKMKEKSLKEMSESTNGEKGDLQSTFPKRNTFCAEDMILVEGEHSKLNALSDTVDQSQQGKQMVVRVQHSASPAQQNLRLKNKVSMQSWSRVESQSGVGKHSDGKLRFDEDEGEEGGVVWCDWSGNGMDGADRVMAAEMRIKPDRCSVKVLYELGYSGGKGYVGCDDRSRPDSLLPHDSALRIQIVLSSGERGRGRRTEGKGRQGWDEVGLPLKMGVKRDGCSVVVGRGWSMRLNIKSYYVVRSGWDFLLIQNGRERGRGLGTVSGWVRYRDAVGELDWNEMWALPVGWGETIGGRQCVGLGVRGEGVGGGEWGRARGGGVMEGDSSEQRDFSSGVRIFLAIGQGYTLEDATGLAIKGDVDIQMVYATTLPTSHRRFYLLLMTSLSAWLLGKQIAARAASVSVKAGFLDIAERN